MMAFLHSIWGPSTSNGWLNKLSIENSTIIEAFCKEGLTNGGFNICSEVPGTVTPLQKLELHPNNINYVSPVSTVALLLLAVFWLCSNVSQGIYWFWLNVPNVVVSGSALFNAQLRISFFFILSEIIFCLLALIFLGALRPFREIVFGIIHRHCVLENKLYH